MMSTPAAVEVHLTVGFIHMPKRLDWRAALVQWHLKKGPSSDHSFAFRGRRP